MIVLSWPPRELHPNARKHFHAKARAAKAYRVSATYAAMAEGPQIDVSGPLSLSIDFYPPDKRRRDLDGCLSAVKAGLDGIADAYQINDFNINPITIRRCEPVKGGRVEVRIA